MARDGMEVIAVTDAKAAVAGADVVCCATTSMKPVFDGDWLEDGQLVVSIANSDVTNKRSEVDRRTYERANAVIVNDWETVVDNDQTELLDPLKEGVSAPGPGARARRSPDRQGHDHAAAARRGRQRRHLFQEQFRAGDPVRGSRRDHLQAGDPARKQQDHPDRMAGKRSHVLLRGRFPALTVIGGL